MNIELTCVAMNEVKNSRYIGTIATTAAKATAKVGVLNLGLTSANLAGIKPSKDQDITILLTKTNPSQLHPMFETKSPPKMNQARKGLGAITLVNIVGTGGYPPPAEGAIVQASTKEIPTTRSKR